MDVILKEGLIYLQGANFFKQRKWRKMWMVLFKPTFSGVGRLELHAVLDEGNVARKRRVVKELEKIVVRLQDCLSAAPAPEESCPVDCMAFYLNTLTCNYILASSTSQQWLNAIWFIAFQKDPGEAEGGGFTGGNDEAMMANDIYASWKKEPALALNQYNVSIQTTEASLRCQLAGEYLVTVNESDLLLQELNTGETVFKWPYTFIRKYGTIKDGFSIEAGRRSESGEGLFIFKSTLANEIYQTIINKCSLKKNSSTEPASVHTDQPPIAAPRKLTGPASYNPAEVLGTTTVSPEYATVSFKTKLPSSTDQFSMLSMECSQWDSKEGDQLCQSLGAVNLESTEEAGIYHNWQKAKCPNPPFTPVPCSSAGNGNDTHEWVSEEPEESRQSRFSPDTHSQRIRKSLAKLIFKSQAARQSNSSASLQ